MSAAQTNGPGAEGASSSQFAQTLDRGLQLLEYLSEIPVGLTITELAAELDVHRSIAARLLLTLDRRGYVTRANDGRYRLGLTVFSLARKVSHNVLLSASPLMADAAQELDATIVFHVADGDESVTVASVEPPSGAFRLGMREGARTPIDVAAHGMAILAGRAPVRGERKEIKLARSRGYAISVGEVIPNFAGVCAPVYAKGGSWASVGCVVPRDRMDDLEGLAGKIVDLAERISLLYG